MLDSVKIQRRQSEIRQALAELAGAETLTDETRSKMDAMDREYQDNERRFRAALINEDEQRQAAKGELETRSSREWAEMMAGFEMRQVALHLDEGRQIDGQTGEIVQELRSQGGFRGIPVPWQALEQRAGETISTGTPAPVSTRPIIDRLFPDSMASAMGGQMIAIDQGAAEWPVVTSSVSAGWQASETGDVAAPAAYATTDRAMTPANTLGVQMKITRRSLKQSGSALEQAVRRDMAGAIGQAMDAAVFNGAGASGEPLGVISGAATYGIVETAVAATASVAAFRAAVAAFMADNAASGGSAVRAMIRPELWAFLDGKMFDAGSGLTEWDKLAALLGQISTTSNGLAAPSGTPAATTALLTTTTGGVAPFFIGAWGAVDVIRDPFSDAASGGLRLTALATMDVTVARPVQLRVLTGLELA
ncbi:MAG: phage major capsid protein [Roseovarius sp.]|nr:phage major capsid protein [Roseovarius sp.]